MSLIEQFDGKTKVNEREMSSFLTHLIGLSDIKQDSYKSEGIIEQKEKINGHILSFFEILITEKLLSKEDRLATIKLMDVLSSRNDLLEEIKDNLSSKKLNKISKRLRDKSQSSFLSK